MNVTRLESLALLGGALALVNPISWDEPFGMVMVEALACGTPVLAFARGAAPEIVEHGVTGALAPDVAGLARALEDVGRVERARCRAAATGHFSARRMVAEHLELYASVVDGEPTRAAEHG